MNETGTRAVLAEVSEARGALLGDCGGVRSPLRMQAGLLLARLRDLCREGVRGNLGGTRVSGLR